MARIIAHYLPQFHPIPENDTWWGTGFTEWTNTAKAKPLFLGHYQPHIPADLGFYDLRVPETREAQACMARDHGIEAFCYYHYWFGHGRRILERPFQEVLQSGKPDFPFCLCWANESWTGIWHGSPKTVLVEQTYPGNEDIAAHFEVVLPALRDRRYVTVDDKPLFLIYNPTHLPNSALFAEQWRRLAADAGLPGLFLVGVENESWIPQQNGFDGVTLRNLHRAYAVDGGKLASRLRFHLRKLRGRPTRKFPYRKAVRRFESESGRNHDVFPCVIPNWDNTPRSGRRGLVLHESTPALFEQHVRNVAAQVQHKPSQHRLIFVKSWNEWAEGNHLEPDLRYGRGYLEALRSVLTSK